jgi:steroid Delta-isomerase
MTRDLDEALAAYALYFATLTPQTVGRLRTLATDDIVFVDPFNRLQGVALVERLLSGMFDDVAEPRFEILHQARSGSTGYIRWRFHFRPRRFAGREPWLIEGVSEVSLTSDGRVCAHVDHWDAASQLWERLPLLGPLLRLLRRRLAVR